MKHFFFLFLAQLVLPTLRAQVPLLHCSGTGSNNNAAFYAYPGGEKTACAGKCTTLLLQGNDLSGTCITQQWWLDGTLFTGDVVPGKAFCYDFPTTGIHTIRHEVTIVENGVTYTSVAECQVDIPPCCDLQAAFSIAVATLDSTTSQVGLLLTNLSQNLLTGAYYVFETSQGVIYSGTTWPGHLDKIPFGKLFDRLCLTISDEKGCTKKYCLFLQNLPSRDRAEPTAALDDLSCQVYPNPAEQFLQVSLGGDYAAPVQFSLYSESGSLVYTQSLSSAYTTIPIYNIPAGFYLVQIRVAGKKPFMEKVVVGRR